MIYLDNLIEKNSLWLRNLVTTATMNKDVYSNGSGSYGFFTLPLEKSYKDGHIYYCACTYKFTTTNQSPSWVKIYSSGGSSPTNAAATGGLTANTEYFISDVFTPHITRSQLNWNSGTIYQGASGAIAGVTGYVKNVLIYDVTELQAALLAKGENVGTNALMKIWCDTNLIYHKYGENYDIRDLVSDNSEKLIIKKGIIVANEFIEDSSVTSDQIKKGIITSRQFDNLNLVPNGDCKTQSSSFITSSWTYDTEDVAGDAIASIVQPVNAGAGGITLSINIIPNGYYKVSYWVKCKRDMTSFLTAIYTHDPDGFTHTYGNTIYTSGTKTQLTTALEAGATEVKVKSNANWAPKRYSRLGFRSGPYVSYHDKGIFSYTADTTGIVSGVSGTDTILLKTAYTGSTMPINTYVVHGGDGGVYAYPIDKAALPTDNEWHYVEGYFGSNTIFNWDGEGTTMSLIPKTVTYITFALNIYKNTGTVPIKFADVKIEPVGICSARRQNKIEIKGAN